MADLFSLTGKLALVTGGAQGLGRMIAQGLIEAGCNVVITSRRADICEAAAEEMGERCNALPGDAGTPDGISVLATRFRAAGYGKLHILVNNAGRTWGAPLEQFPDKAWPGVLGVNVQAPFRLIQELLPELKAAASADDPARIINIGSAAGRAIMDFNAYSYVASKAAIHQLSRQLAADLAQRHINVNAVLPGYFPTSMISHICEDEGWTKRDIPLRRLGRPSDIGGAVVFLSSRAGAYLTGVELPVDGGITGCR